MTPETMILADGSEVVLVHFLVLPADKFSKPHLACLPGLEKFESSPVRAAPWMRTEESRSVSCPLCKATEAWKAARATYP